MMASIAKAVEDARAFLNDRKQPYRYEDADLVQYANEAFATMFRLRPDFRLYGAVPSFDPAVMTAELPSFVEAEGYYPAFVDYVVHRALMRDDQYMDGGISALLVEKFRAQLIGTGA